jgi:hypothetical protein
MLKKTEDINLKRAIESLELLITKHKPPDSVLYSGGIFLEKELERLRDNTYQNGIIYISSDKYKETDDNQKVSIAVFKVGWDLTLEDKPTKGEYQKKIRDGFYRDEKISEWTSLVDGFFREIYHSSFFDCSAIIKEYKTELGYKEAGNSKKPDRSILTSFTTIVLQKD